MITQAAFDRSAQYIAALYFFSGALGLAYQVLWARMLSLQFGVSIFGVVITAAAFMLGLGLGALFGGQMAKVSARPLRLFAIIELSVAAYAILLPFIMRAVDVGAIELAGDSLTMWYALQLCAALLLITIPATAMGLGFPLILKTLEKSSLSLSSIYGLNTCGGAIGALVPLLLLPLIGWALGIWLVALAGGILAFVAWFFSRRMALLPVHTSKTLSLFYPLVSLTTLLAYAGVGAGALMLEVGWTRLFGMLLLRTEYVMAIILAVFLAGIGLGSLLARHLIAKWWFDILPLASAVFALLSLWAIPVLAAWAESAEFNSLLVAMLYQGGAVALLTLPVTLLLGAWLPMLSSRFANDKLVGAQLYGANSVGAALGALFAGFVLIPLLGTHGAIVFAALLLFVSGMVWAQRRTWLGLPVLIALAVFVLFLPPVSQLLPESQSGSHDIYLHEDALAITHVVERQDGQRLLLGDLQRMDASSEPLAVISQQNQVRLPLLLHPDPKQILFLGLGTGISASASLAYPELQRTAVELSQGAINATRDQFSEVNQRVFEQMKVMRDDARRYLQTRTETYDVIVGDLFHPDLVGRSALLSLQQFQRARARLNEGGVFVQWLALNQFDPGSLQVVMRTFQQAFPNAVVFIDGFRLALVGGVAWQASASALFAKLDRLPPDNVQAATGGEGGWSWLGRYWGVLQLPAGPIQTEWAPVIEYRLPQARYGGDVDLVATMQWLLQLRPSLLQARQTLAVSNKDHEAFERGYVASDLMMRAWVAQMSGDYQQGQRLMQLALQANPQDRWVSGAIADQMFATLATLKTEPQQRQLLERILYLRADHAETLKALWQLELSTGNVARANEYREMLRQVSPLETSLRASVG